MKKCPSCDKTFEDSMRFCQVDGTPLVDDVPAFDPYATIVAQPKPVIPAPPPEPEPAAPIFEPAAPEYHPAAETPAVEAPVESDPAPSAGINHTVSSLPIHEPEEVLDLPSNDPLKTMYVSEAEMQAALSGQEAKPEIIEIPPVEETPEPVAAAEPEPEIPSNSFSSMAPPPSPFSVPDNVADQKVNAPSFNEPEPEPEPEPIDYNEAATMIQPAFTLPADPKPEPDPVPAWTPPSAPEPSSPSWASTPEPVSEPKSEPAPWTPSSTPAEPWTPPPAPVAQWTPPSTPEPSWQVKDPGSNTPVQTPPSGGGQNSTLGLVSLILGIVSFVCLYGIGGLAAIILGIMQRSKIKKNPAEYGGGGLAMAGIILGVINIIVFVIILIVYAGIIFASLR